MHISIKNYYILSAWLTLSFSILLCFFAKIYSSYTLFSLPFIFLYSLYTFFFIPKKYLNYLFYIFSLVLTIYNLNVMIVNKDFIILADILTVLILYLPLRIKKIAYYHLLVGISLLISMAGALLNPNVFIYTIFIMHLIIASFALNASNLYNMSTSYTDKRKKINFSIFAYILKSAPLGLLFAVFIFLVFPRISRLHIHLPFSVKNRFQVGYIGNITLSNFGELTIDNTKVLQIGSNNSKWLKKNFDHLYLKGTTLDLFDGKKWRNTQISNSTYLLSSPIDNNKFYDTSYSIDLDIITNPMFNDVIFLPEGSRNVNKISYSVGGLVYNEKNQSLKRKFDDPIRYAYKIKINDKSSFNEKKLGIYKNFDKKEIKKDFFFNKDLSLYDIPESIAYSKFFNNFRDNFEVSSETDLSYFLFNVKQYFYKNFEPTLLNSSNSEKSLQTFLEQDKQGHCEFFATAAVLLFRSYGIPSRIVAGYKGGSYNELANISIVRQSDAHAWVEFYVPDRGWYIFDPTPFVMKKNIENFFISQSKKYFNALNYWLSRYMVDYDSKTQIQFYRSTKSIFLDYKYLKNIFILNYRYLLLFVSLFLLLLVVLTFKKRKEYKYPFYYYDFLKFLKKNGSKITKKSHESFHVFALNLLEEKIIDKKLINYFLHLIEEDLYSSKKINHNYLSKKRLLFTKKLKKYKKP